MRLGLTANPAKPAALELAREVMNAVKDRAEIIVAEETRTALGAEGEGTPLSKIRADVLVAIGGDGTFLHALDSSALPLLAINSGTFGFLAEVEGTDRKELRGSVDRLLEGRFFIEDRMKLASELDRGGLPDATNELVVHTSQVARMRHFEVAIDGRPLGRLRADAIIIATPTGSTSYALSVLGPIVDPGVEAIIVATLAPFHSTPRTVVVDPNRTVSIRLAGPKADGVVVIDGQSEIPMEAGSVVTAYRSPRRASFVRFSSRFFRRLKGKQILPWTDEPTDSRREGDADLPTYS